MPLLPIVQAALDAHQITCKVFECDPALADTAAFCARYGFRPNQSANTIVVIGKGDPPRYAACVVLATAKLDVNKAVYRLLGTKKASFAPMDTALELTHMEYGGVTAFGLPADMPLYVDAAVIVGGEIVMGGGNRSSKVVLDAKELHKFPGVHVVEGLAKIQEL
ncbi:MAG TPA: YbaK/EbsC family protein [Patescibacteria group bacterium]|nr:YbaK/EbsC family protein [Patescibacteria group bacterium]